MNFKQTLSSFAAIGLLFSSSLIIDPAMGSPAAAEDFASPVPAEEIQPLKEAEISRAQTAVEASEIQQLQERAEQELRKAEEKLAAADQQTELAQMELEWAREKLARAGTAVPGRREAVFGKLIWTGLVLLVGYLLIFSLIKVINRHVTDLRTKHLIRKNVIYLLNLLIIFLIIFIWLQHLGSITIFVSAVGAGVALALQEVILCMAGWTVIMTRRPFEVGDRIEFGDIKGDVIDIEILQTSMLEIGNWVEADQSTGRIVKVPNSAVFKNPQFNYSRGFEFIWNELRVLITYESDWKKAEEIILRRATKQAEGMEEIVKQKINRMSRRYMIYYRKLSPIVYIKILDSGVELTLRYLTEARQRRSTEDELTRWIMEEFARTEDVNFAYPTYRIIRE